MLELEVRLDFACCCCENDMGLTLKCSGPGMYAAHRSWLPVKAPCPHCGEVNKILFSTDGKVHHLEHVRRVMPVAEPSLN